MAQRRFNGRVTLIHGLTPTLKKKQLVIPSVPVGLFYTFIAFTGLFHGVFPIHCNLNFITNITNEIKSVLTCSIFGIAQRSLDNGARFKRKLRSCMRMFL